MDLNYDKAPPRIEHHSSEFVFKGLPETTSSEVIRKKLEAELRAAEALGKVKQVIIEKRLAVELAVIDEEHKRKKSTGTLKSSAGHSSRASDEDRMEMKLRRDASLLKNKFLWVKKDSSSREVSTHSFLNKNVHKDVYREPHKDFLKDLRHDHRSEAIVKDSFREGKTKKNHKQLKRLFSKKDTSAHDSHVHRKKKGSSHVLRQRFEDEDLQESTIGEEDAEVDEEEEEEADDPALQTTPKPKNQRLKQFFQRLRKNNQQYT